VQKESEIKTLAVAELALPGLVRPIAIIHRRGRHLTAAVTRFITQLRDDEKPRSARTQPA
jgi:DNA-binding transcriptional LysR family regulator